MTTKYAPGKNPNSLKNLKGGPRHQGYATKLAQRLNWTARTIKGSMSNGIQLFWAMQEKDWQTLTLERRTAILEVEKEILAWRKQASVILKKIEAVKRTPLRTVEAHEKLLRERRIARRRKDAAKP